MTGPEPKPIDENKPLPSFRNDLQLFRGPDENDGSPTFNIYDPIRAQYYKIHWAESLILRHYKSGMSLRQLRDKIEQHSTLKVEPKEILAFFEQAARLNLLAVPKPSKDIEGEYLKSKHNWLKWILFNYLYIRVTLVNPDTFLGKTLRYVRPLVSWPAFILYFIFTVMGIILLLNRFDEFLNTFSYFYNFQGLLAYGFALTSVKVIHELAHAYTAKYYHVRVPAVGVALLVLWPVLFTDVTDSWKMASRRKRLMITIAGVVAELIVAGLCTFGWSVTEPGILQSVFFVIASATWITTLLVNINPAMRFDGYYILADLWGIDNLMSRAFAVTRWKIRQWLWGLDLPPPEEGLSPKRIQAMVIYSIYTWVYRIFLYTAVAIFVYLQFTKALGVFLFFLEIVVFIAWPIFWEIGELYNVKEKFSRNIHLYITLFISTLLLLWVALPLPHQIWFPAVTIPTEEQIAYAPYDGIITNIYVERDQHVDKNQPLIELNSPRLTSEIKATKSEVKALSQEIQSISVLPGPNRALLPEKIAALRVVEEQLKGLLARQQKLIVKAEIPGEVYYRDEFLKVGQGIGANHEIAKIANVKDLSVMCYVPENLIYTVHLDQVVSFWLTSWHLKFPGIVDRISPHRETELLYPQLASINQGYIPVVEGANGSLHLIESYFTVRVLIDKERLPLKFGMLGYVIVQGPPRSYLVYFVQEILRIFWQESGI